MTSKDWFRKHTWTDTDQAEFFKKLSRSRTAFHKAQYTRIQAYELYRADRIQYARDALKLLDMIVENWMDDAQRASVQHQRAECLKDLGRDAEAINAYRETFIEQRRHPSDLTNAHLDFAWWIATSKMHELFDEAMIVLDEFTRKGQIAFPAAIYYSEGSRALIQAARGEQQLASTHARRALDAAEAEHSGLRYHPKVGLVKTNDEQAHSVLISIA